MTAVLQRLLTLALTLAFLVGVTVQLMPPTVSAAQAFVSADMSGGCAGPDRPCTGHMPNCIDHIGCLVVPALPASRALLTVSFDWTSPDYAVAPRALSGISVKPELSPPILAA